MHRIMIPMSNKKNHGIKNIKLICFICFIINMEKVIYSNNGGLGLILENDEKESDFIENQSFVVNGEEIKPGNFSDLLGFFTDPMRFCGALKENKNNCMVFYCGESTDLFEKKRFYYCVYWISETRIANKYTWTSARDFNYKNGEWK